MKTLLANFYRSLPVVRDLWRMRVRLESLEFAAKNHAQESFLRSLEAEPRFQDPKRLLRHEHRVYSQNGEDGMIAEIFRRIGKGEGRFVEIGVGDGRENNTTYLLAQGWKGVWVEGDGGSIRTIRDRFPSFIAQGALSLVRLFVTKENIAGALETAGVPKELDLLSIDVDLNTYWVWEALASFRPRVVVVEYNATFPSSVSWIAEYSADKTWDGTFNFGASLKAYERLGKRLGYSLVGCGVVGINAFFVRDDLTGDRFAAPFDSENHYEPPRYWLSGARVGHPNGFPSASSRVET